MTAAGPPSEDILDSTEVLPRPRRRSPALRLAALLVLVVAVLGALYAFQALQPEPVQDQASPSPSPAATSRADPSLVDQSARRLYGELEPTGARSFSAAARAATTVAEMSCRDDIPSWAATLVSSGEAYLEATFLMSPANRRYGTFVLQVELTWLEDHYTYAVVAGQVERCL